MVKRIPLKERREVKVAANSAFAALGLPIVYARVEYVPHRGHALHVAFSADGDTPENRVAVEEALIKVETYGIPVTYGRVVGSVSL